MDAEINDKTCRVMCKLSALEDFFSLCATAQDRAAFGGDSASGLSFILSDCIGELREIMEEPRPGDRPRGL